MNEGKKIKITDKRIFDDQGEIRDKEALEREREEEKKKSQDKEELHKDSKEQKSSEKKDKKREPQAQKETSYKSTHPLQIDFATFVSSLHTSALMHLGIIPNPIYNEDKVDLDLAKQNIDILEMLESKTKGNLDDEEANILANALYDLRMRYVELTKKQN